MRSVANHRNKVVERASARPQAVTRLKEWLTVTAIVGGGAWAGIEFFWDRQVAPLLVPTLVQGDNSHKVVMTTDCCSYVEITMKFTNVGKRPAYVVTSNFVIGSRSLTLEMSEESYSLEQSNTTVLHDRAMSAASIRDSAHLPINLGSTNAPASYTVLATGELLRPVTTLSPNESVIRQLAIVVPRSQPFVSVRSVLVVAHKRDIAPQTVWTWFSDADTLSSQVMPWPQAEIATLAELRNCALDTTSPTEAVRCERSAKEQAGKTWALMGKKDPHFYTAPHMYDFVALRDAGGRQ